MGRVQMADGVLAAGTLANGFRAVKSKRGGLARAERPVGRTSEDICDPPRLGGKCPVGVAHGERGHPAKLRLDRNFFA
jgi:hypothetical protein